jgi:hypothetical protein
VREGADPSSRRPACAPAIRPFVNAGRRMKARRRSASPTPTEILVLGIWSDTSSLPHHQLPSAGRRGEISGWR